MPPRATVRAKTATPNENYASSANGFLKLMAEMPRICHSCEKHVIYFENLQMCLTDATVCRIHKT
jgi:hypothetical protein